MKTEQNTSAYKDLVVWQKAIELVVMIYQLTEQFPKQEQYGLSSQMKRAAVSIPSNIAERCYRSSKKEFVRFLYIAYGSAAELETQLEVAKQLSFDLRNSYEDTQELLLSVMKMLNKLIASQKLTTND